MKPNLSTLTRKTCACDACMPAAESATRETRAEGPFRFGRDKISCYREHVQRYSRQTPGFDLFRELPDIEPVSCPDAKLQAVK